MLDDPDGSQPADPISWFVDRYGAVPDYSSLLEQLAPTPAQRRDLLAGFFEPTLDDIERGDKVPTRAHRAVAELVASGAVRLIITTNFDRLIEQAVQALAIEPLVVASASAAAGTIPLAHSRCTIIKVHGDYLDPNFKNTVGELQAYDPSLDALLDRAFDDYGLIVCGWSATWDPALRNAIERCPSRRYGTYWTPRRQLPPEAERLADHRSAIVLTIDSADTFFESLASKVQAINELGRRTVGGVDVVIAEAKRHLPDPANRIRLHDLAMSAVDRSLAAIDIDGNPADNTHGGYMATLHRLEDATTDIAAIVATIGQFGDRPGHTDLVQQVLTRLMTPSDERLAGLTAWINLRGYPALLAMYAAGVAATASDNTALLVRVLNTKVTSLGLTNSFEPKPLLLLTSPGAVLESATINASFGGRDRKTPLSDYLHERMETLLTSLLHTSGRQLAQYFDEWEFLRGVTTMGVGGYPDIGRFIWQDRARYSDQVPDRALTVAENALLDAGLFERDPAKLAATKAEYITLVGQQSRFW